MYSEILKKSVVLYALCTVLCACLLHAGAVSMHEGRLVPKVMNYQGYLTDTLGVPITDSLDMNFKIFDAASSGNELWSESQLNVPIERGVFSVILGETSAIPDSVFADFTSTWLELTLEGPQTLAPRTRITAVGYAYTSTFSDTAEYARVGADNDWVRGAPDSVLFTAHHLGIARGSASSMLHGDSVHTHINLGVACTTGTSGQDYPYATISGGYGNIAGLNYSTVGGGFINRVDSSGSYGTVAGGHFNRAREIYSTVGGGYSNVADNLAATISGGFGNQARGQGAVVGGGRLNTASGFDATVTGGNGNFASGGYTVVCGGVGNQADSAFAVIGGGSNNLVTGNYSIIPGGYANTVSGNYSCLIGKVSTLTQDSTFMVDMPHIRFGDEMDGYEFPVSDGTDGQVMITDGSGQLSWTGMAYDNDWVISGSDMYSAVTGNVGIGTAGPVSKFHVAGDLGVANSYVRTDYVSAADTVKSAIGAYVGGCFAGALNNYPFMFRVNNTEKMRIDTSGNVGIGTSSPTEKLQVDNGNIKIGTADRGILFYGGGEKIIGISGWGIDFQTESGTSRMTMLNNGNIGVHTTTPQVTFDVNGVICGGVEDTVKAVYGAVLGGYSNLAGDAWDDSAAVVVGGWNNSAIGKLTFVGGGRNNIAGGNEATVGGGGWNAAGGSYATVAGGFGNSTGPSYFAAVGGGHSNFAYNYATVAGGRADTASGEYAAIAGGYANIASGEYAAIAGGNANTAKAVFGGVLSGYNNLAGNEATDTCATVAGGYNNTISSNYAFIGGGSDNIVTARYVTLGGGYNNYAYGAYSTISGGTNNAAGSGYGTVAGGYGNVVYFCGTASGGADNVASGDYATVGGGSWNTASGDYAAVAGGYADTASATYSFATNNNSNALHDNSAAFNGQATTASGQTRVGVLSKASGTFTIDHPLDPENKILNHYFVESPEMVLIYRGVATIGDDGRCEVHLPDYYDALNERPQIQLTGVGTYEVYIAQNVKQNNFVIGGKPGTEVHWTVTGARKDPSAEITRIIMPVEQPKDEKLAGRSLDDDFLCGTMQQLEQMGKAGQFHFRTADARQRYEEMKRAVGGNE